MNAVTQCENFLVHLKTMREIYIGSLGAARTSDQREASQLMIQANNRCIDEMISILSAVKIETATNKGVI